MDIAVIGMSGRFPEANSVEEFHMNLKHGRDSIREVSQKRVQDTGIPADRKYQDHAYLEDIDKFDYEFFGIALGEAQYIDPHQRILLEEVYHTIENAGYSTDALDGSKTCVYIGDTQQSYYELAEELNPTMLTGNLDATTAGRISRFFNFLGNAAMIDTACSSSLVALHLACNDLKLGDAEYAVVCGANIILMYHEKNQIDETGIASQDGRAKAFAASANGTGAGEAVCCVLLKPLEKALQDGDRVHAIIKGTAINQDAKRASSLTAPSSTAQAEVITNAWRKSNIDPSMISYIEAHGTGTPLGDPIEFDGITKAFSDYTQRKQFCAISALKTNIGHTDTAAGLCGLIKVILSLKNKELFPSLHFDEPNPFIDFVESPLYVNTELRRWDVLEGDKRLAGLSSFGISGTNCHVIVEEAPDSVEINVSDHSHPEHLFTFSGKSQQSLFNNIRAVYKTISSGAMNNLRDISYTLNIGRKHHPFRYAVTAESIAGLNAALATTIYREDEQLEQKDREFWILFSDLQPIDADFVENCLQQFRGFNELYQDIITSIEDSQPNTLSLIFQVALIRFLEKLGVSSLKVIGDGKGKLVVDVLKNKLTIAEAVQKLSAAERQTEDLTAKLEKFVASKLKGNNVYLIDIGNEGQLSMQLKELTSDDDQINFMHLTNSAAILNLLKLLYNEGIDLKFDLLYDKEKCSKVTLPGYQFQKTRCWIKSKKKFSSTTDITNWFYKTEWQPSQVEMSAKEVSDKTFMIITKGGALSAKIIDRFRDMGNRVVTVLAEEGEHNFKSVQPIAADHSIKILNEEYIQIFKEWLIKEKIVVDGIFSFLNISELPTWDTQESNITHLVDGHFYLLKALERFFGQEDFRVLNVCSESYQVANDETVHPVKQAANAFYAALQSEFPMMSTRVLDLDKLEDDIDIYAEKVIWEFFSDEYPNQIAYRQGQRMLKQFDKLEVPKANPKPVFKEDGTYLITGGNSGVGLEIAKYIAHQVKCTIVVLSRTKLPEKSTWEQVIEQEEVSVAIQTTLNGFLDIENHGSIVDHYAVDVGDLDAMQTTFKEIDHKGIVIDGLIHAAGVMGPRVTFSQLSFDDFKLTQNPKVAGTATLEKVLSWNTLDFIALFSSFNTVIPQSNTVDYNVANAFQDAFAQQMTKQKINCVAINWGSWGQVGAGRHIDVESDENLSSYMRAWSTTDGLEAFHMALKLGLSNVSIADIDTNVLRKNPFFDIGPTLRGNFDEQHTDFTPPVGSTETEAILSELWFKILAKENIQLEDNFFELGGHSLLAKRLINLIASALKTKITFRNIYEYPTIRLLASFIDENIQKNTQKRRTFDIAPLAPSAFYEVSPGQKEMWTVHQFDEENISYNITQEFLINGSLNVEVFKKALACLVKQHEVFRTIYCLKNDQVMQKVLSFEECNFSTAYFDLRQEPEVDKEVDKHVSLHLSTPFSLEKGPLLRTQLLHLADDEYLFLFATHHINYDNWSAYIILDEVMHAYENVLADESFTPDIPAIQYKEFAHWLNKNLNDEVSSKAYKKFWMKALKDAPILNLPTDKVRPSVKQYRGDSLHYSMSSELAMQLNQMARYNKGSLFVVLMSIVKLLLYKYSNQTDIIIGTPVSTRDDLAFENQIGLYINLLPIRTRLDVGWKISDLLREVNDNFLGAMDNKLYPFSYITRDLKTKQDQSRSLLLDVLIVLNKNHEANKVSSNDDYFEIKDFQSDTVNARYDLVFEFNETPSQIDCSIIYNVDLFNEGTIQLMKERLLYVSKNISDTPGQKIEDIDWQLSFEKQNKDRILKSFVTEEKF